MNEPVYDKPLFDDTVEQLLNTITDAMDYDPIIPLPSEWAANKRWLPEGFTPKPGKFTWKGFEYLTEIIDSLHPLSPVREVAVMKGTQIAFTVGVLENWKGFVIDKAPTGFAYVNADETMAKNAFNLRLDAVINQAGLSHKIFSQNKRKNQRKSGDTNLVKEFINGYMLGFGAKSGNKLRSNSFRYIACDEFEGFPKIIGDEGDTIGHIRRRTDAYKELGYKILWGSTPKIQQTSLIEPLFLLGDQRRYFVPCLHCGNMDYIKWANIKYDRLDDGSAHIEYDKNTGQLTYSSVRLVCEKCGGTHTNRDKSIFVPRGEWIPTAKPSNELLRSYHIPGLLSPVGFRPWEDIVWEFCEIVKGGLDPEEHRIWVNTALGETYRLKGHKPRVDQIIVREKGYSVNTLPPGAKPVFVFLTADVQVDRIECELVAWGRDSESWSIDYRVLPGDPKDSSSKCYSDLAEIIRSTHCGFPVSLAGIDARYETSTVLDFCESMGSGVYPVFGHDDLGTNYFRYTSIVASSLVRLDFNGMLLKQQLYRFLDARPVDGGKAVGLCHFPKDYKREHYQQLTAEDLIEVKGKLTWDKGSRKNERLDIRYYNLGLVHVTRDFYKAKLGLDDLPWGSFWDVAEQEIYGSEQPLYAEEQPLYESEGDNYEITREVY